MEPIRKNIIVEIICILFMLLFAYGAVSKLVDYEAFKTQLGQSPLLSPYVGVVAWFIPAIEILITILFFFTATRSVALYSSYTLMVVFTSYIIAITRFSDYVPCSCGGVLQHLTWDQHLILNFGFVFLSLTAIILYDKSQGQPKTC